MQFDDSAKDFKKGKKQLITVFKYFKFCDPLCMKENTLKKKTTQN